MDEYLNKCYEYIKNDLNGEVMEIGDEYVFSLNNCSVNIRMAEGRELKINVVGGKPVEIDAECPLF